MKAPQSAASLPTSRAELDARLEELRSGSGYVNYLRVRDWVLKMKQMGEREPEHRASDYWLEELAALEYLLDASPLVIDKLRQHTYPVTGIRAYDYRSQKDEAKRRFAEKLAALVQVGGHDLLVPEPPLLGGFGHEIDGALHNIDTLKYFEALIALDRGGALDAFRKPQGRPVIWEIGAGWGGLAYQFKTLFPKATYVIVDLPDLFLFSATYLMTAFPQARVAFYSRRMAGNPGALEGLDFVFVPNNALGTLDFPRLDLTVNMVSFQEMTTEQVRAYAQKAWEAGSSYLYSLNRERSLYNAELESVSAALGQYYWAHEIHVLDVNYTKMLDKARKKKDGPDLDYKHIVGKRRILT